ncbi:hypothetical protein BC936DRAFT_140799 [Jimgerdemannia flammicorona]|uniref:Uncharacterized protein n=1 Tax=Jimgerdemannia flammicorona TaxID=994334 RepID=A0A433DGN0_9FUNG|nr:hypothetical protein BC936DRAFT_140799 [Jimgerdemannia flammicorona]
MPARARARPLCYASFNCIHERPAKKAPEVFIYISPREDKSRAHDVTSQVSTFWVVTRNHPQDHVPYTTLTGLTRTGFLIEARLPGSRVSAWVYRILPSAAEGGICEEERFEGRARGIVFPQKVPHNETAL